MKENLLTLLDETIAEDMEIIGEWFEEEIQPLIDYQLEQEKKQNEKLYREVLQLEEETK